MTERPLVSVIIPTKNSARTLRRCLESVRNQTYGNVEIIVIDSHSTDETREIARKLADKILVANLKRSAARNYGVAHCSGKYVLILDSDMYLTEKVIADCVVRFEETSAQDLGGLVIPEKSVGEGFWAKVKALEREFYQGVPFMEAARFFPREVFMEMGGYDEDLESGEDWEFSQRVAAKYRLQRIHTMILHDEGRLTLRSMWAKKMYYGSCVKAYTSKPFHKTNYIKQFGLLPRLSLFLRKPKLILRHPFLWTMVFFLKGLEYLAWMWGIRRAPLMRTEAGMVRSQRDEDRYSKSL